MTVETIPVNTTGPRMVPLANGATALLRDPAMVSERLRRPIVNARNMLGSYMPDLPAGTPPEVQKRTYGQISMQHPDLMSNLNDAIMACFTDSWSFDFPVSQGTMQDLPAKSYDALLKECEAIMPELFPNFDPTPDADSPTASSSDSEE